MYVLWSVVQEIGVEILRQRMGVLGKGWEEEREDNCILINFLKTISGRKHLFWFIV